MRRKQMIQRKFRIWEALVDSSYYFALAGLKAQGFGEKEAKRHLKKRWERAGFEHHQANLEIVRKLYGKTGKVK